MTSPKPGIPKGTRDFGPAEMARRNYIFDTIRRVFQCHGYAQIETPAMENLDSLMGKYGEEGDKLLFKILNSGDFLSGIEPSTIDPAAQNAFSLRICEKGLRYDLTVPFARYVVQHQHEIVFPFRRFQIQPVWRADRPQKGRYREFYQCDADVIGSNSLLNEADLISMIDEVFKHLDLKVVIRINNRKILAGIAEMIGEADKLTAITVAIDKLDKIGMEAVFQELQLRGVSVNSIYRLEPLLAISGTNSERLSRLAELFGNTETGLHGVAETATLLGYLESCNLNAEIELDLSLARGLNYYTGTIVEVRSNEMEMGSICGGGRYDDLTGIFGLKDISGVGISFGADRIYDVLYHLNRFPDETRQSACILFANFGEKEARFCLPILNLLQQSGIAAEIYPDPVKLKKQLEYANSKHIAWVALAGESEIELKQLTIKNMHSGEQEKMNITHFLDWARKEYS